MGSTHHSSYGIITSTKVLAIYHSQMKGDSGVYKQYLIIQRLDDHAELLLIFIGPP